MRFLCLLIDLVTIALFLSLAFITCVGIAKDNDVCIALKVSWIAFWSVITLFVGWILVDGFRSR